MQREELLARIRDTVSSIFGRNKIELVDLTYKRRGSAKVLRILADTLAGITLEECAKLNEIVGEALDREDFVKENYILEISSPGLDRPLKTKGDFMRLKGKRVRVRTFLPINEKKEFIGTLRSVDDTGITVFDDSRELVRLPLDKISKATLDYEIDE